MSRTTLLDVVPAAHEILHGPHIDHVQACPPAPVRPIYISPRNLTGLSVSEASLSVASLQFSVSKICCLSLNHVNHVLN
jgi:hypothetical protein